MQKISQESLFTTSRLIESSWNMRTDLCAWKERNLLNQTIYSIDLTVKWPSCMEITMRKICFDSWEPINFDTNIFHVGSEENLEKDEILHKFNLKGKLKNFFILPKKKKKKKKIRYSKGNMHSDFLWEIFLIVSTFLLFYNWKKIPP